MSLIRNTRGGTLPASQRTSSLPPMMPTEHGKENTAACGTTKQRPSLDAGPNGTLRAPLVKMPAAPPLAGRSSAGAHRQIRRHHEPIAGLKLVDSDAESDDEEDALQRQTTRTPQQAALLSNASSFKRSAAVSRQASDASAAGAGFQLLRHVSSSAASTPTGAAPSAQWSRRTSRSNSMASTPPVLLSADAAPISREQSLVGQLSRLGSAARNSISQPSTPDIRIHKRALQLEEVQAALEEEVARRQAMFAPENVLIRRWLTAMMLGRSANTLIRSGGMRISEYNAKQNALRVLSALFVPAWRLHVVRRRRKAQAVIQRFIFRVVIRRRLRKRHQATDTVRQFLQNKTGMFQHYARYFIRCVKTIQRVFRVFKARRDAMVELNCLFVKKFEKVYWQQAAIGAQEELDARFQKHVAERKQAHRGKRMSISGSGSERDVDAVPPSVPSSFPTFESLGHIPASVLRKNIRPLISRKARQFRSEVTRRTNVAIENYKRVRRGSLGAVMKCPEMSKRSIVVKLPGFRPLLTIEEIYEALDNSVVTLAALRDAPIMTLHLSNQRKTPLPDMGSFSCPWMEVSASTFAGSEKHLESSDSVVRRCSLADIFGASQRDNTTKHR